jgi:hypothetical protein
LPNPNLTTATLDALAAELNLRTSEIGKRRAQRADLTAQIAALDREIALLKNPSREPARSAPSLASASKPTPPPPSKPAKAPGRPSKPKRAQAPTTKAATAAAAKAVKVASPLQAKPTLADSMAAVMSKTRRMRADEIVAAMAKAGVKSKAKYLRSMVYVALGKDKRFKRVGRGLYVLA